MDDHAGAPAGGQPVRKGRLAVFLGSVRDLLLGPKAKLGHFNSAQTFAAADFGLDAEQFALTTQDGLRLVAYEVRVPDPRAVVVFLAGIHMVAAHFFGHARMLSDHGYASILLEMRAHGESEGDRIALGFHEHRDTRAVVDYIRANSHYDGVPIVVYGLSMGGAVAINSIGLIPEIAGLVSMSAYSGVDDVLLDKRGTSRALSAVLRPYIRLRFCLMYGWDTRHMVPREQIKELGERPALLIHSTKDSQVPFASFERLVKNAPLYVETWVLEGDRHLILDGERFMRPNEDGEYANRILGFLGRHFGR